MYVHVVVDDAVNFLGVRVWLLAAAVLAITACAESPLVPCRELVCPPGSVCTAGGCASPADVLACKDKSDGDACHAGDGGTGVCQGGACHTGLCGNGKKDIGEKCDGSVGLDPNKVQKCSDDCTQIYECGNAVEDPMEECDDGNQNAADGCDQCKKVAWSANVLV